MAAKWTDGNDMQAPDLLIPGANGHLWEKGLFTAPADIPVDKVLAKGDVYRLWYGKQLEKQGWSIVEMRGPFEYTGGMKCDPDRKQYIIYAHVKRRPRLVVETIHDSNVAWAQAQGYKVKD